MFCTETKLSGGTPGKTNVWNFRGNPCRRRGVLPIPCSRLPRQLARRHRRPRADGAKGIWSPRPAWPSGTRTSQDTRTFGKAAPADAGFRRSLTFSCSNGSSNNFPELRPNRCPGIQRFLHGDTESAKLPNGARPALSFTAFARHSCARDRRAGAGADSIRINACNMPGHGKIPLPPSPAPLKWRRSSHRDRRSAAIT